MQEAIFAEGNDRILLARIFHNKVVGFGREWVKQYLSYFSPVFLFVTSGNPTVRFTVPGQGLLYFSFLLCLIVALVPIKNDKLKIDRRLLVLILFLLLLAPLPASLTLIDSPNIHRALFLCFTLIIFAGYGLYKASLLSFKRVSLATILSLLILGEFIYFWHQYAFHADLYNSLSRNDGVKQTINFIKDKGKDYDTVLLPSFKTMSLYYLFYTNDFSREYAGQFKLDVKIDSVKNFEFLDTECPSTNPNIYSYTRTMIVDSHNCPDNKRLRLIKRIIGKDNLLGYKIYSTRE